MCTPCSTGWRRSPSRSAYGALDGRDRGAHPYCRQHRHRRLRSRAGDGVRGAAGLRRPLDRVPVRLQHRPHRRVGEHRGPRPRDDTVHRRQQDVHHDGDADQRPARARVAAGRAHVPARLSRDASPVAKHFVAVSTEAEEVKRRSASTPTTCSASGTGSAGATRSTPRSGWRSWWSIGPGALP